MSSGYFGIRNCFRIGSRAILKANAHRKKSYKLSLRNFKKQRIFLLNSALSSFNIKYNNFMYWNKQVLNLTLKVLTDILINNEEAFKNIIEYTIKHKKKEENI